MDFRRQVEPSRHGKSSQDRSKKPTEKTLKKRRHLGGILEASWDVLGALKSLRGAGSAARAGGGGYAEAPLKDSSGFLLDILMYILGISLDIGRLRRI